MPSFSIEVEGETSPLSVQEVLKILRSTSSTNQQNLKVASQQLSNWEKTPGYYVILQDVYIDFPLPQQIRFQAIIQLKNGIDKYWRKTSTHAIEKQAKELIRSRAIEFGIQEPVHALALQNALMLAKIVRYEFPHDWPDVVVSITQRLRDINPRAVLPMSNLLIITLQVIKELASGRLQRTKRSLEAAAPDICRALTDLYGRISASGNETTALQILTLKSLRRLLIVFEHPHRDPCVQQIWPSLVKYFQELSLHVSGENLTNLPHGSGQTPALKQTLQLAKLYREMARQHPASFVLLGALPVLRQCWSILSTIDARNIFQQNATDWDVYRNGDSKDESPSDKLALNALLIFRACVKMTFNPAQTFKYQTPEDKEDKNTARAQIKDQVLTDDFVLRLMELLVTQYFVLRPADLRDWEQEPDEWERREEEIADAWEFSIRSCSEKLFLDLVINFKDLLVPELLKVFYQYATTSSTKVLLKDSLYSAIGIAAACLDDVLDFNTFLRTTLVPEVQLDRPGYNLLRRRAAILLGQWVPMQPTKIDRVLVYQVFTHLLAKKEPLNDHVVQVTAGRQLRLVLEPFEFSYDEFAPYATQLLSSIMLLTSETELSETKMALLETVRVAVTKLEGHIEPYADGIMSMLPPLWTASGEEHLMKQAILTMITAIVNSLRQKSLSYHPDILPLIHDSLQPQSEAIVYLLEEALELWTAILQQTPTADPAPSKELLTLASSVLPLLNIGSESIRQTFELVESYTILSPMTVLDSAFLTPMLDSMRSLLPMLASSRARDASLAPHVIENLAATLSVPSLIPSDQSQSALQHLLTTMHSTSYLPDLLDILKEAYTYHQDPRPNKRPPDVIGPAETSLFTLLARLALHSPTLFIQAINANGDNTSWLMPEWISHFDSIGDILRKKLQTLAVTALLTASNPPPPFVLDQLQSLMTIWTDVITELGQDAPEETQGDYLFYAAKLSDMPEWPDATPEDGRKRVVSNADPIYAVNVRFFVAERFQAVMHNYPGGGQPAFETEWLGRIDGAVVKAFVDLKLF